MTGAGSADASTSSDVAVGTLDTWRTVRSVGSQGAWAVADQALFAGSNLIVNVLLARWLPGVEYGAFVTAYTVLLLVQLAHAALLIEPMLIFGADRHQASFSHYFDVLQRYHWRLMVAVSACMIVLATAIAVAADLLVGEAIAGLALTAPFILMSWLARRACYGASQPRLATLGGGINLAVVLTGLLILTAFDALSVMTAQLLLGAAAVATTWYLLPPLARITSVPLSTQARSAIWTEHWQYARWSSATSACTWFHTFIYYLMLPRWSGLAAAGGLKALMNLITPILHSDAALVTLLLPQFVRSRRTPSGLRRIVWLTVLVFSIEAVLYWIGLGLFGHRLVAMLYGGAFQFDQYTLWMIGAIPLLSSLVNILGNALRARQQPDGVFWATVAAVLVAGTGGAVAVAVAGITGALVAMIGSGVVQVGVMVWLLARQAPTIDSEQLGEGVAHA